MKIAMIGTGYVGLVTGTCFAEMGNEVICVDKDEHKIAMLKAGEMPIYEPGLKELVVANVKRGQLEFTADLAIALKKSEVCFIAVGTPMGEDGSADLQYVLAVAQNIGAMMEHDLHVVNKSTVPVGTADLVKSTIQAELTKRQSELHFSLISNPEFLKEGSAVNDFLKPDRVIIGTDCEEAKTLMQEIYAPFMRQTEKLLFMDIKSAELTKYAANAMLATKISFINEMANICEHVGADINEVRMGIGSDSRIGYSFIYPGCGYGGSCFPKDVQALINTSISFGYEPNVLVAVEMVNMAQKQILSKKITAVFGEDLTGLTFAVWGLAFKPGTDDMRQAPSITLIENLTRRGAAIRAYDPEAMPIAQRHYLNNITNIEYCQSKYDALTNADAMVLVTEWQEFRSPDFLEIAKRLKGKYIFDGRNQYNGKILAKHGIKYDQIGKNRHN